MNGMKKAMIPVNPSYLVLKFSDDHAAYGQIKQLSKHIPVIAYSCADHGPSPLDVKAATATRYSFAGLSPFKVTRVGEGLLVLTLSYGDQK